MGYYSELTLVVQAKDEEKIVSMFEGTNKEFFSCASRTPDNNRALGLTVIYYWDWIKFYTYFDEYKDFMELLKRCDNIDIPWSFAINGEDLEDIQIFDSVASFSNGYNCCWNVDVVLSIDGSEHSG